MRKVLLIFSELTDGDVDWLSKAGERIHVDAGATLVPLGARVDNIWFVLDGAPRGAHGLGHPARADGVRARSSARCRSWTRRRPRCRCDVGERRDAAQDLRRDGARQARRRPRRSPRASIARCASSSPSRLRSTTRRMGYGDGAEDEDAQGRADRRPARQRPPRGRALRPHAQAPRGLKRRWPAGDSAIFRKAALERLASPERLDARPGLPSYPRVLAAGARRCSPPP